MKEQQQNTTVNLLRIIGSPFLPDSQLEYPDESLALYNYAFANRVELLYLEALKRKGKPNILRQQYEELHFRYRETLTTVARIAGLFNSSAVPYVVFKTVRPYAATPNDVDILFLGSGDQYTKAIELMLDAGYVKFGEAPRQTEFYDTRGTTHLHLDKKGGIYYLDLYQEAATDYFIYMDKRRLCKYVTTIELTEGEQLRIFEPEVELAIIAYAFRVSQTDVSARSLLYYSSLSCRYGFEKH